jgi:hypothetical protein
MSFLIPRILSFWLILAPASLLVRLSFAATPIPNHGGVILQKNGSTYELVHAPESRSVKVYAETEMGKKGNQLVIYVRTSQDHLLPIRLNLSSTTPESAIYSGIIPSRIQVTGGMQFEIGKIKSH